MLCADKILDAAARAFQSSGYSATSMHEIMRAARATGGATYHHFPTKKALGIAVIRERVAKAIDTTWLDRMRSPSRPWTGPHRVRRDHRVLEAPAGRNGMRVSDSPFELALADADFRIALHMVFDRWRGASPTESGPIKPAAPSMTPTPTTWRRSSSPRIQAPWPSPKPRRIRLPSSRALQLSARLSLPANGPTAAARLVYRRVLSFGHCAHARGVEATDVAAYADRGGGHKMITGDLLTRSLFAGLPTTSARRSPRAPRTFAFAPTSGSSSKARPRRSSPCSRAARGLQDGRGRTAEHPYLRPRRVTSARCRCFSARRRSRASAPPSRRVSRGSTRRISKSSSRTAAF